MASVIFRVLVTDAMRVRSSFSLPPMVTTLERATLCVEGMLWKAAGANAETDDTRSAMARTIFLPEIMMRAVCLEKRGGAHTQREGGPKERGKRV